eukprot:2878001-Rhodomonas_salina.1
MHCDLHTPPRDQGHVTEASQRTRLGRNAHAGHSNTPSTWLSSNPPQLLNGMLRGCAAARGPREEDQDGSGGEDKITRRWRGRRDATRRRGRQITLSRAPWTRRSLSASRAE